jgi:predicted porin
LTLGWAAVPFRLVRGVGAILRLLGFLVGLGIPTAGWAQEGFYVIPSLAVAEVFDDNLFYTSEDREQDLITRFTPDILIGYRSTPFTLTGRYTFDAEVYASHSELTTAQARQRASIDARYLAKPSWTLALTTAYTETQRPQELNLLSGLAAGRQRASDFTFTPSTVYRFNPLTEGIGAYTFVRKLSGGESGEEHAVNLGLNRRLTPLDTVSLGYLLRYFTFTGDDVSSDDTTTSNAFLLGWTRQITPLTRVELRAGPRFSSDELNAEVAVSVRRRLKHGELALGYARTQDVSTGVGAAVDTDSVFGLLSYQISPFLRIGVEPLFARNSAEDSDANVYQIRLSSVYQLNKWLSFQGSYYFGYQQGSIDSNGGTEQNNDDNIHHNVIFLGVVITYPYRIH